MTAKLTDVVVKEVSLVPKGANGRKVFLRKADETATDTQKDSEMEDQLNDSKVALEKAAAEAAEAKVALEKAAAEKVDLEKRLADLEKAQADAKAQAEAEKATLEKAAAEEKAKAEELEKALAVEKEAKEVSEAIQKAAVDFKNLPEKAEDLGPLLRNIRKSAGAEAADKVEALLKKIDALAKSALDPKGTATAPAVASTTLEEIEKRARKMVADNIEKSYEAAFDRVLLSDKSLYAKYQAELPRG